MDAGSPLELAKDVYYSWLNGKMYEASDEELREQNVKPFKGLAWKVYVAWKNGKMYKK